MGARCSRAEREREREREARGRGTTDFLRVEYAGNTLLSGFAHTCKDNKSRWWKKSWPRAITDELALAQWPTRTSVREIR